MAQHDMVCTYVIYIHIHMHGMLLHQTIQFRMGWDTTVYDSLVWYGRVTYPKGWRYYMMNDHAMKSCLKQACCIWLEVRLLDTP